MTTTSVDQTTTPQPAQPSPHGPPLDLLDALLLSTSHDLRSPLLTIGLSAELIANAVADGDDRTRIALDSMKHGLQDAERMIEALTALSRARRRTLDVTAVSLVESLSEHLTEEARRTLAGALVAVDAGNLDTLIAALGEAAVLSNSVESDAQRITLVAPLPAGTPQCDGSPLAALLGSLQTFAGTPIAALAALQVAVERGGGSLSVHAGDVRLALPRAQ